MRVADWRNKYVVLFFILLISLISHILNAGEEIEYPRLYKVNNVDSTLKLELEKGFLVRPLGIKVNEGETCRNTVTDFISNLLVGKSLVILPSKLKRNHESQIELFAVGVIIPDNLVIPKGLTGIEVGFTNIDGGFFRGPLKVLAININAILLLHGCVSYTYEDKSDVRFHKLYMQLSNSTVVD